MFGKLLDTASLLKAKITKNELQEALIAATTEDNWQAPTTVLHQIASSAFNHEKWERIREFVWNLLKNTRGWKKLLKALHIVEFLLKNGPANVINHFRYEMSHFRILKNYELTEEGVDRGAPIRQRAKVIVDLLQNQELLEDERVRAKQIRQKMSHLAGSSYTSVSFDAQSNLKKVNVPKYQSYNNATFQANREANSFYNYGSGNYGDREDDRGHRQDYFQNASRFKKPSPEKPKPVPKQPQNKIAASASNTKPAAQKQQKPKYETMTQRLLKNTTKSTAATVSPVKPDLSYKSKDYEELLGPQISFTNSKYEVQKGAQYSTKPAPVQQNTQPIQAVKPVQQAPANLLSELDGLSFLGVQAKSQPNNQNSLPAAKPSVVSKPVELAAQSPQPAFNQIVQQNPLNYAPTPPAPLYNNYGFNNNPVYGNPNYAYGNNNAYPNYAQQNYYQNPYQIKPTVNPSYGNPYYYQSPPTQPYYQQGVGVGAYSNTPVPNYNNSLPASYAPTVNPYANISESVISQIVAISQSTVESPVKQKVEVDEFDNFKKSGNFDTEKIYWMSSKQKTLTDLTDLNITIKKEEAPKQTRKQFSNNLKFDLWAW